MYSTDELIDNIRDLESQVNELEEENRRLESENDELVDPDCGDWIHVDNLGDELWEYASDSDDWIHVDDATDYVLGSGEYVHTDDVVQEAIDSGEAVHRSYRYDFEELEVALKDLFDAIGQGAFDCCEECVRQAVSESPYDIGSRINNLYELFHSLENT